MRYAVYYLYHKIKFNFIFKCKIMFTTLHVAEQCTKNNRASLNQSFNESRSKTEEQCCLDCQTKRFGSGESASVIN